ncbi:MAG: NapC/NirT family cytochrome c [Nitrospira sp.]|nr:NapC/NirT family cytochrome c [bacterium]MBL7048156.1 NapC/NirT family cytochrome c [Nitrospira sp.]
MSNGNGGSKKGGLSLILVLVAFAVIVAVGGTYYAGTNNFCGSCHQMKTRFASWEKSTHKDVKCITCHSEPGFVGEMEAHIAGLGYLKSFIKGTTENITIFATRKNPARINACIHCHPAETLPEETAELRIDHDVHIENGFLCTDCHKDIVHSPFNFDEVKVKEASCVACHMTKIANINCQTCHIKVVDPGSGHLFVLDALEDTGIDPEDR